MVVRFITRRFIGDYDPNLEKVYTHNTVIDNDVVLFEILDATGQMNVSPLLRYAVKVSVGWKLTHVKCLFIVAGSGQYNTRGEYQMGRSLHTHVLRNR